jgi:PhnB protein
VTPYIAVREARELIEFVKKAFDAEGAILGTGSEGGIHGEFRIGDSMLMIGGGEAYDRTPNLTGLHYYVPDVDVVYERAIAAGASSLHAPVDQFYGDREAGVKDVAGNYWYIATHQGKSYVPEGLRSVTTFLHPKGAHEFIDFLKNAFDAEQISRYDSPDGRVAHATIRIGDSVIEMGETHGEFQPMSTMFLLYVEDVDFWYRRAVKAGAVLISEPADQPYGDRTAGVSDSFGNTWYMATHIKDVKF